MPTQLERRETTRAALLVAARELFTEKGFAATGREEIAERAGVTRGALYHHFASKQDAFHAVALELDDELGRAVVRAAARAETAAEQIVFAARAYLDACADPSVVRILLVDAPAVLGTQVVRELNDAACALLLAPAINAANAEGRDIPGDPMVAAQLLLGMLNEAAAVVATSPKPTAAAKWMRPTVDAFVARLLGLG